MKFKNSKLRSNYRPRTFHSFPSTPPRLRRAFQLTLTYTTFIPMVDVVPWLLHVGICWSGVPKHMSTLGRLRERGLHLLISRCTWNPLANSPAEALNFVFFFHFTLLLFFFLHIRNNFSTPLKVNTTVTVIGINKITFAGGRSSAVIGQCDATCFEGFLSASFFDVRLSISKSRYLWAFHFLWSRHDRREVDKVDGRLQYIYIKT